MNIWIDFENSPHPLFFRPIVNELKKRGHNVFVTARDFAQTVGLARDLGLDPVCIGKGVYEGKFQKFTAVLGRVVKLAWHVRNKKINLALSHGSRAQVLAAKLLGITSYVFFDYDYSETTLFHYFCSHVFVPEITLENFQKVKQVRDDFFVSYPGIKEEVYLYDWPINSFDVKALGLSDEQILAILRLPASFAHYHSAKSDELFDCVVNHLLLYSNVTLVFLPRYEKQRNDLLKKYKGEKRVIVLSNTVDGISLMAHADLVISGGGTMNREAAILGIPTYSVFAGPLGTIDAMLERKGLLRIIRQPDEISRIPVCKKNVFKNSAVENKKLPVFIVQKILDLRKSQL